jgi:hypothetical protein
LFFFFFLQIIYYPFPLVVTFNKKNMNNVIIQYATHSHMLKCVYENEGLGILVK